MTRTDEVRKLDHPTVRDVFFGLYDINGSTRPSDFDNLRGVATCDPKDTFDVNEGKKIARKKLLKKYHHRMKRGYELDIETLKKVISHFEEFEKIHAAEEKRLTESLEEDLEGEKNE